MKTHHFPIFVALVLIVTLAAAITVTAAGRAAATTAGVTSRVSVASDGTEANASSGQASISADGRYVAFESDASNLVPGDTNSASDIFVHDRAMGETSRVSMASDGTQGNDPSSWADISSDGRYVVFQSDASNLVPDDTNGASDVFVHDRATGETIRASVASDGMQGFAGSSYPSISADGRYVSFQSWASNLVPGDTNGAFDIFVHDRTTGETTRVSVASDGTQSNHESSHPSISDDGRFVAFRSKATSLVQPNANLTWDVYVHDRMTGETTRASVASDGANGNSWSTSPSISGDGRYVAFSSFANNLVPGDTNGKDDAFVRDRATGETTRVSVASDGTQGNESSYYPSISGDGRYVAFHSKASNLVPGDKMGSIDVFVHDRTTGKTTGEVDGNGHSQYPNISDVGRYVAFESDASNLVPGDTNGTSDIFVHDRTLGYDVDLSGNVAQTIEPGAVATYTLTLTNTSALSDTYDLALSGGAWPAHIDGPTSVALAPGASLPLTVVVSVPAEANDASDVVILLATSNGSANAGDAASITTTVPRIYGVTLSGDVAQSAAPHTVVTYTLALTNTGMLPDIHNLALSGNSWSVHIEGPTSVALTPGSSDMVTVVVWVPLRTVTGDNDTVVLTAASQANPTVSDMVHLTTTVSGVTSRVSINSKGWQADRRSFPPPSISDSGRYVAFQSWAGNLVSTDTNGAYDIFVHDRTTGGTSLVSVASDGTQGYGPSQHPSISGNGRFVAFQSEADNLVPSDTNGRADVFVHDRVTGDTKRVSVASDGTEANASSDQASISADGRYVAYHSGASNLVPGDTNGRADVFVHDRVTGETTRASVSSDGREGNLSSRSPSISADGRFVAFASEAYNLVPGDHFEMCNVLDVDPFPCRDIFVHDRTTRETTRVSVASHGAAGNDWSGAAAISGNGRYVAFQSHASNLVPGDTNTCHAVYRIGYVAYNCPDIFVHDRTTGVTSLVSVASDGTQGNERSTGGTSISGDGRFVGFRSFASNLVPGDTNETWDVFIHDRTTGQTSRVSIASDGTQGNSNSTGPSISADGRYVAFSSNAVNLVTRDTNGDEDIFVHDRHGGYGWSYLPLISRP